MKVHFKDLRLQEHLLVEISIQFRYSLNEIFAIAKENVLLSIFAKLLHTIWNHFQTTS